MYPLLALYLQLYGVCASNGIDPGNIANLLKSSSSVTIQGAARHGFSAVAGFDAH